WQRDEQLEQTETSRQAVRWFGQLLSATREEAGDLFSKYRLSEVLMLLYKRFWDDFCSWYLEIVKPAGNADKRTDADTYDSTLAFFDLLLHLLHPFMPFITEEIWQSMAERREGDSIMVSPLPAAGPCNKEELEDFSRLQELVVSIRGLRQSRQIPGKTLLKLYVKGHFPQNLHGIALRMAGLESVQSITEAPRESNVYAFLVGTTSFFVPLGNLLDKEEERSKLNVELEYHRKFLASVDKKLSNESFLQRAPRDVVAVERKKRSDALTRIASLEQQLDLLQ
ncbi:MAG: class I tRNA ligase family protein, partial [Anaerolineaceae bacterium]|nr:class I tRNA ligase family protein [Anaerolineaceae bacterium]